MRIASWVMGSALALGSTGAFAQTVSYDFDKGADFSRLKTYAWTKGTELGDALNHKRVVSAVDAQLQARGMVRVEAGANPDVLVAYHASFDRDLSVNGFATGFGPYRFGPGRSGTARVEKILVGTLVVDMVDAKTKTIVWRATAVKEVDTKASPEKREKNINKAAEKLFKNYPPKA
jgi:hypothetical protein